MSEIAEVMYPTDMDATTFDTDLFFDQIARICNREGVTGGSNLHEARKQVEATGGSFDTFGYLASVGAPTEELEGIAALLGDNAEGIEYLYPDTEQYISTLGELEIPFATITFGSELTQLPKIRSTILRHHPYLITQEKIKGRLIAGSHDGEAYSLRTDSGETLRAKKVMVPDDKAASFGGLPEDCGGYLVQRKPPKPSQMGEVPPRIRIVKDLSTITKILVCKAL